MDHSETVEQMSIQGGMSDANQTPNPNKYSTIKDSQQFISDL